MTRPPVSSTSATSAAHEHIRRRAERERRRHRHVPDGQGRDARVPVHAWGGHARPRRGRVPERHQRDRQPDRAADAEQRRLLLERRRRVRGPRSRHGERLRPQRRVSTAPATASPGVESGRRLHALRAPSRRRIAKGDALAGNIFGQATGTLHRRRRRHRLRVDGHGYLFPALHLFPAPPGIVSSSGPGDQRRRRDRRPRHGRRRQRRSASSSTRRIDQPRGNLDGQSEFAQSRSTSPRSTTSAAWPAPAD